MSDIKIIKVYEDRQKKVHLSPQNLEDLIGMRDIIGENNIIIQADGKLLIRHYIGYVQLNKTRLLIYPKVAIGLEQAEENDRSFEIMLKMLAYSDFYGIKKIPEPQQVSMYQNDLLELYIGLFIDELTKQFQRDVNRGYNYKLENQSFIKGKVDFNETIKHNSYKRHLHYVRYDEFNENTLLNQIFKAVILVLIVRSRIKSNKLKLKQLLLWLEDVDSISISDKQWNGITFTRQNEKYETAFHMAKLFYFNASPSIRNGETSALSFLVPANQLFEMYLYKLLERNLRQDYTIKYQGPMDYLAYLNDKKFLQMKPDITLLEGGKVSKIIDAKYKIIENLDDLSQGDVYQMLAYSVRYRCNNILLVYPKLLGDVSDGVISSFTIQNYDQVVTIRLVKIDLVEEPKVVAEKVFGLLRMNLD
jgi:5-methylcytosine-specific restriction enzyme subunit McrC